MKYIEGQTLAKLNRPMSQRQIAKLIATIADALHYAHTKDFVHRDVKPANILLDKRGVPHLADFGLALHEDEQHVHVNECAGTRQYMSPEQTRGKSNQLDHRSDIWNVGVILYELLSRKRPFSGSEAQLFEDIRHRPHRPLRSRNPSISKKLESICDRCLQKKPEERYATAADLARDLRRAVRSPWRMVAVAFAAAAVFAMVTALVAERFIPQWRPFLDRQPIALVRKSSIPLNTWRWVPGAQRFEVRSAADESIAVFGKLSGNDYRIRTQLRINGWVGFSGIVFAMQPVPGALQDTRLRCYAVCVGRSDLDSPLQISFEQWELASTSGIAYRVLSKNKLARAEIPDVPSGPIVLEVRVSADRAVEALVDSRAVTFDSEEMLKWRDGGYGVTSVGEYCVFELGEVLSPVREQFKWQLSMSK
jgi:serine/threonine protein kinase